LPDFSRENIPNRKKYQMTTKEVNWPKHIIPNGPTIFQKAIKYTKSFHSMALQNISKLRFLD
jgi:hypothetical protein